MLALPAAAALLPYRTLLLAAANGTLAPTQAQRAYNRSLRQHITLTGFAHTLGVRVCARARASNASNSSLGTNLGCCIRRRTLYRCSKIPNNTCILAYERTTSIIVYFWEFNYPYVWEGSQCI